MKTIDREHAVSLLPPAVQDIMKRHGKEIVCAGGFLRSAVTGADVNDIDLFVADESLAVKLASELRKALNGQVISTQNAVTVTSNTTPVQFVHRWKFKSPKDLISLFDFTVTQAAIWYTPVYKEWYSVAGDSFYSDIQLRRVRYTSPPRDVNASRSLIRLIQLAKRGYDATVGDMAKIVANIDTTSLDFHFSVASDQPIGRADY